MATPELSWLSSLHALGWIRHWSFFEYLNVACNICLQLKEVNKYRIGCGLKGCVSASSWDRQCHLAGVAGRCVCAIVWWWSRCTLRPLCTGQECFWQSLRFSHRRFGGQQDCTIRLTILNMPQLERDLPAPFSHVQHMLHDVCLPTGKILWTNKTFKVRRLTHVRTHTQSQRL